jgi:hypothetical protein
MWTTNNTGEAEESVFDAIKYECNEIDQFSNVTGQSGERKVWAQRLKFPGKTLHKWLDNVYIYPERDSFYLL